jgi:hypothetical protein
MGASERSKPPNALRAKGVEKEEEGYQRFGGSYCLHLQGEGGDIKVLRSVGVLPQHLHGVTTQKTSTCIFTGPQRCIVFGRFCVRISTRRPYSPTETSRGIPQFLALNLPFTNHPTTRCYITNGIENIQKSNRHKVYSVGRFLILMCTKVYTKVSGLAAWSEDCKWYSSLPIGAVVSLFCDSV